MKQRILFWDITKSFAIFLVVWGHCLQNMTTTGNYFSTSLTCEVIISFHMALFMLVSGYFAYSSLSKPFGDVMKKRAVQLLLPSVTWFLIIRSMSLMASGQLFSMYGLKELITGSLTSLWFLKALFVCYLIVMIGASLYRKSIYLLPIYIIGVYAIGEQLNYSSTISMLPFFLGGLILRKYEGWIFSHSAPIFALSCVIWMYMICSFDIPDYSIYHHPFALNGEGNFAMVLRTVAGLSGALTSLLAIRALCRNRESSVMKALAKVGSMTLGIYCIQVLFAEVGSRFFAPYLDQLPRVFYDLIITSAYSIVVIAICVGLIIIIRTSKYSRLLLLGEN